MATDKVTRVRLLKDMLAPKDGASGENDTLLAGKVYDLPATVAERALRIGLAEKP